MSESECLLSDTGDKAVTKANAVSVLMDKVSENPGKNELP